MHNAAERKQLLAWARSNIAHALGATAVGPKPEWAGLTAATFVTLQQSGQLRGCIGSLEAHRTLADDIAHNAVAAALHDPRFPPLNAAELAITQISIAILEPPQPIRCRSEDELLAQLAPADDGVILHYGHHHATFLPQVWEQLPLPRQFIRQLKLKAGLPADWWSTSANWSRYGAEKFGE